MIRGLGPLPDYPKSSWGVLEGFWPFYPLKHPSLGRFLFEKVRLIEAHLSIKFPRLSDVNLPPKSQTHAFNHFALSVKNPWEDPFDTQQELRPPCNNVGKLASSPC